MTKSLTFSPRRMATRLVNAALLAPFALMLSPEAEAQTSSAQGLSSIAANQQATAGALYKMLANYSIVFGVGMAIMGLIQIAVAHKKNESMKIGAVMVVVGGLLASIIAVLTSGSATVFTGSQVMQIQ